MTGPQTFAVVLGLCSALVAGLVGSFALMKRMTLAGDVISHLALPGLGLAMLWKFPPLAGAAATLAIGILVIDQLQRRGGMITESAIGVVFVAALAIGTLVTPTEDLIDALFGGFGRITARGFLLGLLHFPLIFGVPLVPEDLVQAEQSVEDVADDDDGHRVLRRIEVGQGTADNAYFAAALRLHEAELDLCRTRADRVAACEKHLKRMEHADAMIRAQFEAGRVHQGDAALGRFYRLDAEIRLERAKVK